MKSLLHSELAARGVTMADLAERLSVHPSTVTRWVDRRVPAERVLDVEKATGIKRHSIRPDLYPDEPLPVERIVAEVVRAIGEERYAPLPGGSSSPAGDAAAPSPVSGRGPSSPSAVDDAPPPPLGEADGEVLPSPSREVA